MPWVTSGRPKVAFSEAMRRSQARAISSPPARQCPFTAARMGLSTARFFVIPPRPGTCSERRRRSADVSVL
jgi:hypothetical protein